MTTRMVKIDDRSSADSVEALEFLLAKARNGEVVGLAYIAQLKRKRFVVDTAGAASLNPVQFLGMTSLLTDDLIQRAKGRTK